MWCSRDDCTYYILAVPTLETSATMGEEVSDPTTADNTIDEG